MELASRWRLRIAFLLILFAALVLSIGNQSGYAQNAKVDSTGNSPLQFSHDKHSDKLDMKDCTTCHQSADLRFAPPPTTKTHAPCLSCHLDEFLSTGIRTQKQAPEKYRKASAFCAICHFSPSGAPPMRHRKNSAAAYFQGNSEPEFHVEMDHFAHTKRTTCSSCHSVDPKSFKLRPDHPNHEECAQCHTTNRAPMTKCASCHTTPGPQTFFNKTRKASDVRVCTSDSKKRPCFKHERKEHRFQQDETTPFECDSCHFMFAKDQYRGHRYQTIANIKSAPLMDNSRDLAHKSCGAQGCHRQETDDSRGRGKCQLCHSKKFMSGSLF